MSWNPYWLKHQMTTQRNWIRFISGNWLQWNRYMLIKLWLTIRLVKNTVLKLKAQTQEVASLLFNSKLVLPRTHAKKKNKLSGSHKWPETISSGPWGLHQSSVEFQIWTLKCMTNLHLYISRFWQNFTFSSYENALWRENIYIYISFI